MLANLSVAIWTLMLQETSTSWDLLSMWHSMAWVAKSVIIILLSAFDLVLRRND